ncbi:aminotransferase class I/II-fold pyridoxal phosphate-dependent enzyme [Methylobacterium sp. BTF04]|uniref:aminotransferase class I/II-fold pyridoxal phosphate-dependent enzyme n=1 Tax=Methylobacterium sp. BTF04 TaxID=2708300 RepID=UPI0013CF9501|nr:aminotransferase class I/II-fold pyridoxal phosphate-dependent enzyme [Methylobacterium sp. BTF04]NEU12148.1 aminotransferase class I/II-fold pyridoxal phosphate-dependent enzyme [Methylobacterium sp. BTF04]
MTTAPRTPPSAIAGSPILAVAHRAAALRAAGRDIIDLTLGEPDFAPPTHAVDAAVAVARRPLGDTPSNGRPALREAARRAVARNAIYRERRDAGVAILAGSPALTVPVPAGAFSLFPRLTGPADDGATADRLLEAGVVTVPGRAFGAPGHLRLSFATDLSTLQEGCRRIVAALETRS